MRKKQVTKVIISLSEGLLSSLTDLLLLQVFMLGSSIGKSKNSRGAYLTVEQASSSLEKINYQTIKQSFAYLKRKGFIRSIKEPIITNQGINKLKLSIPTYHSRRTWDKVLYLITYDIPEKKKKFRNQLRKILINLGSAPLQASVWLTPYNPSGILKEFSKAPGFDGEIIVSCIGKNGYIGEESIKKLISRIYKLDEINQRYQAFTSQNSRIDNKWTTAVAYLLILKEDPQLPFSLLPDDWLGDQAYLLYKNLTKSYKLEKMSIQTSG